MRILNEFREFAVRGNVVDLAVGIIIGGAFTTIVRSLVDDIVMPPIGWITGGVDFSNLYVSLDGQDYASLEAARTAGAPAIAYGVFLNNVITFLIVALVVFFLVRAVNSLKRKAEDETNPTVSPPKDIQLLTEIRDLLGGRPAGEVKAQTDGAPGP